MKTEEMIRELRRIANKHKGDKVFTGELNLTDMCTDVADRLEENLNDLSRSYSKTSNTNSTTRLNRLKSENLFNRIKEFENYTVQRLHDVVQNPDFVTYENVLDHLNIFESNYNIIINELNNIRNEVTELFVDSFNLKIGDKNED